MKSTNFALTAAFALAMAFTFSCSGGDDDGGNNSNGGTSSPSSSPSEISSSSSKPSSSSGTSSSSVGVSSNYGGNNKCNSIANCKTKQIGSQTWLAENLNIDVVGSKCYGEGGKVYNYETDSFDKTLSNAEIQANCDKYGRLYDWATAMALDASCNSTSCASQITRPHRGICPSGWHIPSNDDWDELVNSAGGVSTAGTKLKSKDGWESYSGVPAGTDEFGFSALPGGYGYSGDFNLVGNFGYWWSASEYGSSYAYSGYMLYHFEGSYYSYNFKDMLYSVRCLQD